MAQVKNTLWNRSKFKLSGLVLLASIYYLYQSIFPTFPPLWEAKTIAGYEIAPMPFNLDSPYKHDGVYTKDFFLFINKGEVKNIRQAYMNIGEHAMTLSQFASDDHGILHGSQYGLEVHAIAPEKFNPSDKLWLTLQNWQGHSFVIFWDLPADLFGS